MPDSLVPDDLTNQPPGEAHGAVNGHANGVPVETPHVSPLRLAPASGTVARGSNPEALREMLRESYAANGLANAATPNGTANGEVADGEVADGEVADKALDETDGAIARRVAEADADAPIPSPDFSSSGDDDFETYSSGFFNAPDETDAVEPLALSGSAGNGPPDDIIPSPDFSHPRDPGPLPDSRDKELGLMEHLRELRTRLLLCVAAVSVAMIVTWSQTQIIQGWLIKPVEAALKARQAGDTLIVINPTDGFMIFFQISLVTALILAAPFWLFQLWRFIEPALTHSERRYTLVLVPFSTLLFASGAALGYWCSPLFFSFFLQFTPKEVSANLSYSESVVLLAKMLLAFGICFQVPVVTIFVNKIGLVSRNMLIEYWRHVFVAIFVVVAIVTPTWDPITLCAAAVPPCLLYLLSIWLVKWL